MKSKDLLSLMPAKTSHDLLTISASRQTECGCMFRRAPIREEYEGAVWLPCSVFWRESSKAPALFLAPRHAGI
jgi:hypothetical protein